MGVLNFSFQTNKCWTMSWANKCELLDFLLLLLPFPPSLSSFYTIWWCVVINFYEDIVVGKVFCTLFFDLAVTTLATTKSAHSIGNDGLLLILVADMMDEWMAGGFCKHAHTQASLCIVMIVLCFELSWKTNRAKRAGLQRPEHFSNE